MSLELRNRIEATLELKLSVTLLWAHSTLAALAVYLLEQLGFTPKQADVPAPAAPAEQPILMNRSSAQAEPEAHQLAELSEGKLLEMVDDVLAGWEDTQ